MHNVPKWSKTPQKILQQIFDHFVILCIKVLNVVFITEQIKWWWWLGLVSCKEVFLEEYFLFANIKSIYEPVPLKHVLFLWG